MAELTAFLTGTFAKVFSHKFSTFEFNEDPFTTRAGVDVFTEPGFHAANALEHLNIGAFPAAAYFPMDENASGYSAGADPYSLKDLAPAISTSVAFDEDGAWVGQAAVNLWPVKTGNYGWMGTTVANSLRSFVGDYKQELVKDGTVTRVHNTLDVANSLAITSGQYYTVSAYYRAVVEDIATEIDAVTPTAFTLVKSTGGTAIAKANEKLNIPAIREKWQRGIGTAQFNEATTAWPYINWTALEPMTMRVCGMMLEQKPFASAWCYDTRAAGALAFNLHTSCGLNWNEDYTIMYWKKAHGTHDGSASYGYSVDSIGRNANTVGGGFLRWGKFKDGSMSYGFVGTSPAASIANYDNYQYHWYLHVLRRSGTTLTLRVYSVQGLFSSQSIDDSTAVASDRYVTQNGYDLQLGGWDGANPCNTYYRDLVVLPGQGLTDEQLDRMYATKLRIYSPEGTVLFNNLVEGII